MLYVVSTPIGNLEDITLRAIDTLKRCHYILCEDTRHSLKLLNHYEIKNKLISFHQFNEESRIERILDDLRSGQDVALISDAGTPLISDPGFPLIRKARREGLKVTAIPGPSALIAALTLSGFETLPFQFVGFLPKKKGELVERLEELLDYGGTTICYETDTRILDTVEAIYELDPERTIGIARELTKQYEEVITGSCKDVLSAIKATPPRGEIVLLIQARPKDESHCSFSKEFLQSCVTDLSTQESISTKEAIQKIASLLKLPKRVVYSAVHN